MFTTKDINSATLPKKVNFDDTEFISNENKITYKRAKELEKTLGKAIKERLKKEFETQGHIISKKEINRC
jgi:hypothetical protein